MISARPAPKLQIGSEHGAEDDLNVDSSLLGSTWTGVVLSLSFLVVLVSLLAFCGAGGCCGKIHWFGRPRQDAPLSFSNPMTEPGATMMMPISQIDVRALEMDPIVFEPLPTVHDLTPISGKLQSDRGQPNHRNAGIPIVPFSTDDSNVYAHDWFEEPHNNFPRSSIEYVKELGKGWFGQVIEAEARDIVPFARKIRVIVKVLREDANGMEQMRFLDESRMYRDANHGNILKLMGHSIEKLPFLLIMEHCPQGDLKSFLISNIVR
ncbi:Serine/threonine-protein kinase LMTK1 [Orchesella cincta]|uniref:Serine/threonine-protein kinase LMTK1 n=1 Tax=Orchesella cincta TaxID=48709 RepID=A0A1D2NLH7_ORCCI|nr:Serine/threonine-protein kinase LMTK1 [Orchesella cincta]